MTVVGRMMGRLRVWHWVVGMRLAVLLLGRRSGSNRVG